MATTGKNGQTEASEDDADTILVTALACGQSYQQAAKMVGVSPTTVKRRMQEPEFRTRVLATRRLSYDRATGLLSNALANAVSRLELLMDDDENPRLQLQASVEILNIGLKYHQNGDMAERIAALESAAANNVGSPRGQLPDDETKEPDSDD